MDNNIPTKNKHPKITTIIFKILFVLSILISLYFLVASLTPSRHWCDTCTIDSITSLAEITKIILCISVIPGIIVLFIIIKPFTLLKNTLFKPKTKRILRIIMTVAAINTILSPLSFITISIARNDEIYYQENISALEGCFGDLVTYNLNIKYSKTTSPTDSYAEKYALYKNFQPVEMDRISNDYIMYLYNTQQIYNKAHEEYGIGSYYKIPELRECYDSIKNGHDLKADYEKIYNYCKGGKTKGVCYKFNIAKENGFIK